MSTFSYRDNLRFKAADAVRKFLACDLDAPGAFNAVNAFDEAEGTAFDLTTRFCDAAGFDPDALLDTDGAPSLDVDALMDVAAELDDYLCAETPDPYDTWAEARGER